MSNNAEDKMARAVLWVYAIGIAIVLGVGWLAWILAKWAFGL